MDIPLTPVTLVTVVHPICGVFIERFPKMLKHFTDKNSVASHIVIINPADEWIQNGGLASNIMGFARRVQMAFEILPWNVQFIIAARNLWDLPGYNEAFDLVKTPYWVGISPDTRILYQNWLEAYFEALSVDSEKQIAMVGPDGPSESLTPTNIPADWGWIPRLLLDRNIEFDHCHHIQTWCFIMESDAFREAGMFWEAPEGTNIGKGDLITAEIMMSVKLRKAGYDLGYGKGPHLYHYGTNGGSTELAKIEEFDKLNNFTPFD